MQVVNNNLSVDLTPNLRDIGYERKESTIDSYSLPQCETSTEEHTGEIGALNGR